MSQDENIDEYITSAADNMAEHGLSKMVIPSNGNLSTVRTRNIKASFEMEMKYQLTQMQNKWKRQAEQLQRTVTGLQSATDAGDKRNRY
ncbi:MAG: hypothetical protein FWD71_03315 [Oscillospiraceae bacterium]|nr:hypothetical protein [Oscillospiraceae bacterium]